MGWGMTGCGMIVWDMKECDMIGCVERVVL